MAEKMNVGTPENNAPEGPAPAQAARSRAAQPKPAADAPAQERAAGLVSPSGWWLVTEDVEIPAKGGKYLLRRGKILSEKSYDVEFLRNMGAKLEPTREPGWSVNLRETGQHLAK